MERHELAAVRQGKAGIDSPNHRDRGRSSRKGPGCTRTRTWRARVQRVDGSQFTLRAAEVEGRLLWDEAHRLARDPGVLCVSITTRLTREARVVPGPG